MSKKEVAIVLLLSFLAAVLWISLFIALLTFSKRTNFWLELSCVPVLVLATACSVAVVRRVLDV